MRPTSAALLVFLAVSVTACADLTRPGEIRLIAEPAAAQAPAAPPPAKAAKAAALPDADGVESKRPAPKAGG